MVLQRLVELARMTGQLNHFPAARAPTEALNNAQKHR